MYMYIYIYICVRIYIYIYVYMIIYAGFVSPHHFVSNGVPQPFQPSRQRSSACGKMAVLLRTMKEPLEANRRMLVLLEPGSQEFNVATARQQAVFDASLTAMPLIPEVEAVQRCEEAANVGWTSYSAQVAAIMEHAHDTAEHRLTTRTAQRNYTSIEHHMPEGIWTGSQMNS